MRAAPIVLALAATACASHAAQQPRFDPATYARLCEPNPDPAIAKSGGCVLKDQSRPLIPPPGRVLRVEQQPKQPPQQ